MNGMYVQTRSRHGAVIANAWFYGGGVTGLVLAFAVVFGVPVTDEIVSSIVGGVGPLLGFGIGAWIGPEREDRYERRRLGLTRP